MLNKFFSSIIKNLDIPQCNQADQICQILNGPLIKAMIEYRNHPTIAINERCTNSKFNFSFMKDNNNLKEIRNLQINKATQDMQIHLLILFLRI